MSVPKKPAIRRPHADPGGENYEKSRIVKWMLEES
jgi:hypothetical protein